MKLILPEADTKIEICDHQGKHLASLEIIEIDSFISIAQSGLDRDARVKGEWIPTFQALIRESCGLELSPTICWLLGGKASEALSELKKSCDPSLTSSEDTESTPSDNPSPTGPSTS